MCSLPSVTASGFDARPQFDHLILAVPDAEPVRRALSDGWGLEVAPEGHAFQDGLANLLVPLEPPEYLELLYIHDAEAYARQPDDEAKRRLLAGGGLLGWGLRTWDIEAVARELGVELEADMTLADGSRAPWRSVERPGSPLGFPFYIQYDASPHERMSGWTQRLRAAGHRSQPGGTEWVELTGDESELEEWLRPARHLDVRIGPGQPSMRAAVRLEDRLLTLSSDIVGGIEPAF